MQPANATGRNTIVERGRYLAALGDCVVCHTVPGMQAWFAGGYPLHSRFGTIYSTNITPDPTTGIGRWTQEQFYHALHEGKSPGGRHLYPAFPYVYFSRLSRKDSDALYAYLQTLRPIHYTPPRNSLIFPTNLRFGMAIWNWLFVDKAAPKSEDTHTQRGRGARLVHGIAHCGGCHTPKNFLFADLEDHYLEGATIDGWFAPSLRNDKSGIGNWSAADLEIFLRTGKNRFGRAVGSMQDVIATATSRMTVSDRTAIVAYLKSLPPSREATPSSPPPKDIMAAGRAVFAQRCSICHDDTRNYPALAKNSVVLQTDPATLLRVILQGSQSLGDGRNAAGFSMPAFPTLSDSELGSLATFVRNSWGNAAGLVSQKQARTLRKLLEAKF
ncbi:MAG TPA: cytochrome c [Rhizomicrobium sp.]|nr:cytochrome c [Rhizomicrobium sp.]